MKKYAGLFCLLIALLPVVVAAQSSTCPSDQAADKGHDPFATFHEVMAPAWHTSWPVRDYAALIAAGPKFVEAFAGIAAMKPDFTSQARKAAFTRNRVQFSHLVKLYSEAAIANDSLKVYDLLPQLHDAYEQTASSLLPVSFPEFEGMVTTVNLILETHLPKNNTEGIVGSTETLLKKFEAITPETLPEDLRENEEKIMDDIASMRLIAAKMQNSLDKNDMAGYREHIAALDGAIKDFVAKYL